MTFNSILTVPWASSNRLACSRAPGGWGHRGVLPRELTGGNNCFQTAIAGAGDEERVRHQPRQAPSLAPGARYLGVRVGPSDHVRLDGRLIRQRETGGAARVFLIHRSPGENLQQPVETGEHDESAESDESTEETPF